VEQVAIIYTLFGDEMEARDICQQMLSEGLAACTNQLPPVTSHYLWEGQMQTEREYPVIMKSSAAKMEAAMQRLRQLHSYDIPAITGWQASAGPDFANWVNMGTQQSNKLV